MNDRSPALLPIIAITFIIFHSTTYGIRVPAHIFPDDKSTVIKQMEIPESELNQYPKVLDASLSEKWCWTTYEGEFTGYVSRRDVLGRKRLKAGTLIRVDPTHSSWILTKYEPHDDIRVRSRLSVGRVSIKKEIPVYFKLNVAPAELSEQTASVLKIEKTQTNIDIATPSIETIEATEEEVSTPPEPIKKPEDQSVETEKPAKENPVEAIETELNQADPIESALPLKSDPEKSESPAEEPAIETVDPLLEEKPRISTQELVNMAPPQAALYQEFEGYLRLVENEDNNADFFTYVLVTRSGRKIVYIDTSKLIGTSHKELLDQWINIRGTLEEDANLILYIQAKSIWVAP